MQYAVFTEYSPESKLLQGGWNPRIFTDTTARQGDAIQCDLNYGFITVPPGTYHITGFSTVAYNTRGEPPEMTTVRAPASAGYCRLRLLDTTFANANEVQNYDPSVVCIGSRATANMVPSLLETYLTTTAPETKMLLEHHARDTPEQVYLRVHTPNFKWHVFARLSIQQF